jgi:hypothetical protein
MQELVNQVRAGTVKADEAKRQVMEGMKAGTYTVEQALKAVADIDAIASEKSLSFKVSEKGAVSVYGLQRFPVSLYKRQWERLLDAAPKLRAFIAAHPELEDTRKAA